MTPERAAEVIRLDKAHHWHPFTQMQEWNAVEHEPLILTGGEGAWLTDHRGRRYLDGNSSIWTNIHGHGHPVIAEAIRDQLGKVAHVSALGFANEPAARLAVNFRIMFHNTGKHGTYNFTYEELKRHVDDLLNGA